MTSFVEACRREWKRLGVPDHVADDMAAELEADLEEGTPGEVLGRDAADARSFAQARAVERGVARKRRRSRLPAAIALLALVPAIVGAVLTIGDSLSTEPLPARSALPSGPPTAVWVGPPEAREQVVTAEAAHLRAVVIEAASSSMPRTDDADALGIALLIGGLALLVPTTLYSSARVAFGG
jgi:hypothetical protein